MTMINSIKAQNGFQNISIFLLFQNLGRKITNISYISFDSTSRYIEITIVQLK